MSIPTSAQEPRFIADAMLARLARWLRVLGWDTVYDPARHDPELVTLAERERRILLSRDRALIQDRLPRHSVEGLLLQSQDPLEQLREVLTAFGLRPGGELFTRCLLCNTLLRTATADEMATLVPPEAQALPGPIRRCPDCGRMYWPGSHTRRMREALVRALPGWFGGTGTP